MEYKLEVYTIWEKGQRDNQEDWIFPEKGSPDDRLFILCDGMGGHEAGEVASQTVCEAMSRYILANYDKNSPFTDKDMISAVDVAFDFLDTKVSVDMSQNKKMGTTMTCLKIHREGFTVAHMGDSRVYQIRPERTGDETQILFVTRDHSLINDLIAIGELTEEEAKLSKQKNVITRAMQPLMERRPKPDIYHSNDIKKGDFFFLCSDGMLEELNNDNIRNIISLYRDDAGKLVEALTLHTKNNRDNHSAFVIRINEVLHKIKDQSCQEEQSCNNESSNLEIVDGVDNRGFGVKLQQFVKATLSHVIGHNK